MKYEKLSEAEIMEALEYENLLNESDNEFEDIKYKEMIERYGNSDEKEYARCKSSYKGIRDWFY
ncbi:MAG: hypothetical protein PUC65_10880 [Clostridiales bacterium]|nr:hypothetical protein [Clostridiales bacterium]